MISTFMSLVCRSRRRAASADATRIIHEGSGLTLPDSKAAHVNPNNEQSLRTQPSEDSRRPQRGRRIAAQQPLPDRCPANGQLSRGEQMTRLRICSVSSELSPLAKTGGLADVVSALARYLHRASHDVRVFLPLYSSISDRRLRATPVEFLQNMGLQLGPHHFRYSVATAALPGGDGLMFYLVDCPALYRRPGIRQRSDQTVSTRGTARSSLAAWKYSRSRKPSGRATRLNGT